MQHYSWVSSPPKGYTLCPVFFWYIHPLGTDNKSWVYISIGYIQYPNYIQPLGTDSILGTSIHGLQTISWVHPSKGYRQYPACSDSNCTHMYDSYYEGYRQCPVCPGFPPIGCILTGHLGRPNGSIHPWWIIHPLGEEDVPWVHPSIGTISWVSWVHPLGTDDILVVP